MATAPTLYWYQLDSGTLAATYFGQLNATIAELCSENAVTAPTAPWQNSIGGTLVSQWTMQVDTAVRSLCTALSVTAPIPLILGSNTGQYQSEYAESLDGVVRALCAVYHADAVHFDGAAWLSLGAALSGVANTDKFILSVWLANLGAAGLNIAASFPDTTFQLQSTPQIILRAVGGLAALTGDLSPPFSGATWRQLLISCDWSLPNANMFQILDTGVLIAGSPSGHDGPKVMTFGTETDFFVGNDGYGDIGEFDCAQLYFAPGEWLDFTNAANVAKFVVGGKPISLLTSGAPTPAVLLDGNSVGFLVNQGDGGGPFTVGAGSLTNASTSPSD